MQDLLWSVVLLCHIGQWLQGSAVWKPVGRGIERGDYIRMHRIKYVVPA